jgi:hypothetical protein
VQVPGQLADRRRLAGAVDPHGHDHRGPGAHVDAALVGVVQAGEVGQQLGEAPAERLATLHRAALGLHLELGHDARGGRRPDVGHDERLLQPLPRLVVEGVEQRGLDLGPERLAGLGEVLAQPPEEAAAAFGRLLCGLGAGAVGTGEEQV